MSLLPTRGNGPLARGLSHPLRPSSAPQVDLDGRRCVSSAGSTTSYEDLIGADGVNSVVRRAMEAVGSCGGWEAMESANRPVLGVLGLDGCSGVFHLTH